jgi:hypothetical protein
MALLTSPATRAGAFTSVPVFPLPLESSVVAGVFVPSNVHQPTRPLVTLVAPPDVVVLGTGKFSHIRCN